MSAATTTTVTKTNNGSIARLYVPVGDVFWPGDIGECNGVVHFEGRFGAPSVTFTFANLNAPASTQTVGSLSVTATPNPATNSVTVTYGPRFYNGEGFRRSGDAGLADPSLRDAGEYI